MINVEFTPGDTAVIVGALSSHIHCLQQQIERPDYSEENRILTRSAIESIDHILDKFQHSIVENIQ